MNIDREAGRRFGRRFTVYCLGFLALNVLRNERANEGEEREVVLFWVFFFSPFYVIFFLHYCCCCCCCKEVGYRNNGRKGRGRTQVPTTRNYTLELSTLWIIAGVNPVEVQ